MRGLMVWFGLACPLVVAAPNFSDIQKLFIKYQCFDCHSEKGEAKLRPLKDYETLLSKKLGMVKPGKPKDSTLYLKLIDEDDPMPPRDKRYDPISDRDKQTIYDWIKEGANKE